MPRGKSPDVDNRHSLDPVHPKAWVIRREEHHLPVSGIRRQEVQGEKTVLAAAVEEDDQWAPRVVLTPSFIHDPSPSLSLLPGAMAATRAAAPASRTMRDLCEHLIPSVGVCIAVVAPSTGVGMERLNVLHCF